MATKSENALLARIDERTLEIQKKLDKHILLMDSLSIKVNEHELILFGKKGNDGLISKVEHHDKILLKAIAIGGFLLVSFELLKGVLL